MTHIGTTMDNDNMSETHESQAHFHDMYAFQPGVCDVMDDVFAQFLEATQVNRNEYASMSRNRNKAESVAATHEKLKEHCHNVFKQYIAYCKGSHIEK